MSYHSELRQIIAQTKTILNGEQNTGIEFPPLNLPDVEIKNEVSPIPKTLPELKALIGDCQLCKLCNGRKNIVFGEGSSKARIMFIGEGPGRDEDLEGRPFVGEAGKLLTSIIENGIKIKREEVYICNIVKCRPPENRDPVKDEVESCIPFLKKQIEIIKPEVICTLGRIAARELLEREFIITRERGRWQTYLNIPLMPTFHPSYILRNRGNEKKLKGEVWQDIQKIMSLLGI